MFGRIFPKQLDNNYQGYKTAILVLSIIALVKTVQGVESVINTRNVLANADGIALERFSTSGAATVVALFALLGLNGLVLPLLSSIVLVRYRAMIPLMFLLFLTVQIGSRTLLLINPIERSTTVPIGFVVNLVILVTTLIGFALAVSTPQRGQSSRNG
jgi:hypothetical protein